VVSLLMSDLPRITAQSRALIKLAVAAGGFDFAQAASVCFVESGHWQRSVQSDRFWPKADIHMLCL
jgi:hypothetical protein